MARRNTLPIAATIEAISRLRLAVWHQQALLSRPNTVEQVQNSVRDVMECRRALHLLLWDVVAEGDRARIDDLIQAIEA